MRYRSPVSRRRFLAGGAAGISALALAACGGSEDEEKEEEKLAGTPAIGQPKPGGTLRVATVVAAVNLDPVLDVSAGRVVSAYTYGHLLHQLQADEGAPVILMDHAESVETPDNVTYIFHLRPGIRFHDLPPANGRAVIADDVVYSLKRASSLQSEPFWTTYVKSLTAPDPETFRVELNKPFAYAYEGTALAYAIQCKEAVEQWGDLKSNELGSGPFQLEKYDRNAGIDLAKNPNYFVNGIPYLDGIGLRIFLEDASSRVAFRAKQLDMYSPPDKWGADEVAGYGDDVVLEEWPDLTPINAGMVEIDPSKPELGDIRVREAVECAIDRDAMIERLCQGEGYYCAIVSSGLAFWCLPQEELRQLFKYDPQKSRQLLEAAGVNGLSLELKYPSSSARHADIAVMMKSDLADVGIDMNPRGLELGTFIGDLSSHNYHFMLGAQLGWTSEMLPMQFNHTRNFTRDQIPQHPPTPEIDAILDKILETSDPQERQGLVYDATRKILARHASAWLFNGTAYAAAWNYVHGYENKGQLERGNAVDMWLDKS